MYIYIIDNLFDGLLNNFNKKIISKKIFEKTSQDENFVKYQNEIINIIKDFILNININKISNIINNK